MMDLRNLTTISINDINLWAHVGVLEEERLLGQAFLLNVMIWVDVDKAAIDDDLSSTLDYSLAVVSLQELAFEINCKTIERFSEYIFERLEILYGSVPMQISLQKCAPPIEGFIGSVSINRKRNMLPLIYE